METTNPVENAQQIVDLSGNADFLKVVQEADPFLHTVLCELGSDTNLLDVNSVSAKLCAVVCAYTGMFTGNPFQFIQMMTDCCRNMQTTANRMAVGYAQRLAAPPVEQPVETTPEAGVAGE